MTQRDYPGPIRGHGCRGRSELVIPHATWWKHHGTAEERGGAVAAGVAVAPTPPWRNTSMTPCWSVEAGAVAVCAGRSGTVGRPPPATTEPATAPAVATPTPTRAPTV